MEVYQREENSNNITHTGRQDKVDPDHQQTGEPKNSTDVEHVENEEGYGESKK